MDKRIEKANEYLDSAMNMSNIKDRLTINRMRVAIRSAQDCLSISIGELDDDDERLRTKQTLGAGCHDEWENVGISDPFAEHVEKYISKIPWTPSATEYEKTLVAGNIRAFASTIRSEMFELFAKYNPSLPYHHPGGDFMFTADPEPIKDDSIGQAIDALRVNAIRFGNKELEVIADEAHEELMGIRASITAPKKKTCRWERVGFSYYPRCYRDRDSQMTEGFARMFRYCPHCGGRIELC